MVLGRPQRVADFSLRLAIQAEQAGGDDTPSRRGGKDGIGDPAHRCIAHQPSSAVASIPAAALPPALTTHTIPLLCPINAQPSSSPSPHHQAPSSRGLSQTITNRSPCPCRPRGGRPRRLKCSPRGLRTLRWCRAPAARCKSPPPYHAIPSQALALTLILALDPDPEPGWPCQVYLHVPLHEKRVAIGLGAQFDTSRRRWFVTQDVALAHRDQARPPPCYRIVVHFLRQH